MLHDQIILDVGVIHILYTVGYAYDGSDVNNYRVHTRTIASTDNLSVTVYRKLGGVYQEGRALLQQRLRNQGYTEGTPLSNKNTSGVCLDNGQTMAYPKHMGMTDLASACVMARRRPI